MYQVEYDAGPATTPTAMPARSSFGKSNLPSADSSHGGD
jgi:hypothetical protein